jgi:hypothetical protein
MSDYAGEAGAKLAIIVTQGTHGWAWQLVDTDGTSVANGFSADPSEAMERARQTSRSCAPFSQVRSGPKSPILPV